MSRIGKKPIPLPKGVTVKIAAGRRRGAGAEGQAAAGACRRASSSRRTAGALVAKLEREDAELGKFHGLARSLVANAVAGVTDGFKKELDIVGVGYRAELKGKQVHFALGYSHPVVFDIPTGIDIAVDKQTHVTVTGVDRQLVGQVAANIRRHAQAGSLQAEGRPLYRRSAEEEGREDRSEVAGAEDDDAIKTKEDRRDRIKHRIRKRVRGHRGASAADRVPQRRAHVRAGGGRRDRPHDRLGLHGGAVGEGRAGQEREGRQRRGRQGDRQDHRRRGCSRRASSAWCSTATGSSITGASRQWPTRRAKQVWSSNVALMNRRS